MKTAPAAETIGLKLFPPGTGALELEGYAFSDRTFQRSILFSVYSPRILVPRKNDGYQLRTETSPFVGTLSSLLRLTIGCLVSKPLVNEYGRVTLFADRSWDSCHLVAGFQLRAMTLCRLTHSKTIRIWLIFVHGVHKRIYGLTMWYWHSITESKQTGSFKKKGQHDLHCIDWGLRFTAYIPTHGRYNLISVCLLATSLHRVHRKAWGRSSIPVDESVEIFATWWDTPTWSIDQLPTRNSFGERYQIHTTRSSASTIMSFPIKSIPVRKYRPTFLNHHQPMLSLGCQRSTIPPPRNLSFRDRHAVAEQTFNHNHYH